LTQENGTGQGKGTGPRAAHGEKLGEVYKAGDLKERGEGGGKSASRCVKKFVGKRHLESNHNCSS